MKLSSYSTLILVQPNLSFMLFIAIHVNDGIRSFKHDGDSGSYFGGCVCSYVPMRMFI